jgi:hypothetical protein
VNAQQIAQPPAAYKTLEEIEAEYRATAFAQAPPANTGVPPTQGNYGAPPVQPQMGSAGQPGARPLTLEEIEREMLSNLAQPSSSPAPVPTSAPAYPAAQPGVPSGLAQGFPPQQQPPAQAIQQTRPASDLKGLELLQQQLGNLAMFPPLGSAAPGKGQTKTEEQMDRELEARIRETEMAEMKRMRKAHKIASMSRYNDVMTGGESDWEAGGLCDIVS